MLVPWRFFKVFPGQNIRKYLPILFLLIPLIGCSKDRVQVSGKVTHDGKAVNGGTIIFSPPTSKKGGNIGKPGVAEVQSDGTFTVKEGVAPGQSKITYSPPSVEIKGELKPGETAPVSPFAGLVPKTETVDVSASNNTFEIELVPGKKKK